MPASSSRLTRKTLKKCFVVLPYDSRGDEVYDKYLREACRKARYDPERADHQTAEEINKGIETSLSWAPMVCAYLGSPPDWNINVAIEVGYRLSTRRPIVLLCDKPPEGESLSLPFNIAPKRVIELPRGRVTPQKRKEIVDSITATILSREADRPPFASVQAVANIHYPTGSFKKELAVFTEASTLAMELFGIGLVGRTLAQFYQHLKDDMPPGQYKAFMTEQKLLIAQAQNSTEPVIARVPIVFRTPRREGRAFLPIIVNASDFGDIQQLRVLYLDVTSVVKETTDLDKTNLKYYRCLLDPEADPVPLPRDVSEPRPLVFLAHNDKDKEQYVRPIFELLAGAGAAPWLDANNIPVGMPFVTEISKAISECAAAFVFLGPEGTGPFQAMEIPALVEMHYRRKIKIVPVLLPGVNANDIEDVFVRGFVAKTYDQLKSDLCKIVQDLMPLAGDREQPSSRNWRRKAR